MSEAMTVALLQEALPKALQKNATQELADKINSMVEDPIVCESIRENFLTYSKVLMDGKFKTEDYLNAITYVTHKAMGHTNKDAYIRTFPDRYTQLVAQGKDDRVISAYVAMYHKTKLVTALIEQTVVPTWLLFQDVHHRAIKVQFDIMTDEEVSPKVRAEAANSILTHLKQPETKKIEVDMSVKNEGGLGDLRGMLEELAAKQIGAIQTGTMTVHAVAAQKVGAVALPAPDQDPLAMSGPPRVYSNQVIEDAEYVEVVSTPTSTPAEVFQNPESGKSLGEQTGGWYEWDGEEPEVTYENVPQSIDLGDSETKPTIPQTKVSLFP